MTPTPFTPPVSEFDSQYAVRKVADADAAMKVHRHTKITMVPKAAWKATRISANDRDGKALHQTAQRQRWRTHGREVGARLLAADDGPMKDQCRVVITFLWPDNRRREAGNLQPTVKAIVDGLVDSGYITDDNERHVIGQDARGQRHPSDHANYHVWLTIMR